MWCKKTELRLIRKQEGLLEFETQGEGHTYLNVLREALKDHPGVLFAAYRISHPVLSEPIFHLRTSEGINPIDAVTTAATNIIVECEELEKSFWKEWREKVDSTK